MVERNECQYKNKLASGEVLLQKIEAFVVDYECESIKETVELYESILEYEQHDTTALKPFKRTVGYLAATLNKNKQICIRTSFCTPNDFYQFNSGYGKNLAISKLYMDQDKHDIMSEHNHNICNWLINGEGILYVMPYTLQEAYAHFQKRCTSYFKGCEIDDHSFMLTRDVD